MRHFLLRSVDGLPRGVIAAAGGRRLVAARRRPARRPPTGRTAPRAAVLLAPIAAPADVEHRRAMTAAAFAEAVVEGRCGA
jgi:hypothetical protein